MGHPLEQRVEVVRREARGELRRFGVATGLSLALWTLAGAGLLDYLARFDDRGLRTLLSLGCLGVMVWSAGRWAWPALRQPIDRLEIALKLESFFPILRHRLASALEFLAQPLSDHLAGSAALRRGVVIDAMALSEGLDFSQAIDRRPARRAMARCAVIAGALAVVFIGDVAIHLPSGRTIGSWLIVQRLAQPWRKIEWPRNTHLAVRQPVTKLARGDTFEVEVIDQFGVPLPADTHVEYRAQGDDADLPVATEPLRTISRTMTARKERVERSFAYRIEGGDDSTFPWTEVTVIEPPEVEKLAIKLHYPAYIGWPVESSSPSIRAWRGTRIEVSGGSREPLRAATVCLETGARLPAAIGKDGRGFRLGADAEQPFVAGTSGAYWIELETVDGIRGGGDARYELRALEDKPPRVTIERPQANAYVTPSAVVPFDIAVVDDLEIQKIALRYLRSDRSDEGHQEVPLYQGPSSQAAPRDGRTAKGESRRLTHFWELAPLALLPGAQVSAMGVALDYRPLEGVSTECKLSIVSPDELLDRLSERQALILNELARLLRLQLDARSQVEALEVQWKHVAELQVNDIDRLQGGELTQRQVAHGLTDATEGVPAQVAAVIADLEINRIDHPDMLRDMRDIEDTLARLKVDPLAPITQEFTATLKEAQQATGVEGSNAATAVSNELRDGAARVGAGQARVIAELEALLGRLTRWDALRRQVRELAQLREDQQLVGKQTLEIGRQTLARVVRDLTPPERAELERLSLGQTELARRFENILIGLDEARQQLAASDAAAAQAVGDALGEARRAAVGGEMRGAGQSIGENQIGQAAEQQERVVAALVAMLDALTHRQERELEHLLTKLKDVESALAALAARQAELNRHANDVATSPLADAEKQSQLKQVAAAQARLEADAQRLAREMEGLQAGAAARSLEDAAAQMRAAQAQAQAGEAQQTAEKIEQARQALEEAQRQLAQQRAAAEQRMAQQAVDQLSEALAALSEGQQINLDRTVQHQAKRLENGAWTRAELGSLRELARAQGQLHAQAVAVAATLDASRVLQRTLALAADAMRGAADRLAEQDAGEATQDAERRALARLVQLREALQPETGERQEQPPEENSGSGNETANQQQPPPEEEARRLAELKMLKLLQVEVYDGTKALEERRRRNGALTPREQMSLEQLSAEQGKLAEMLSELTTSAHQPALDGDPPMESNE